MFSVNSFLQDKRFLPTLLSAACFCLVLLAMADTSLAAAKSLMITPIRAIFTDRQRTVDLHVSNPGEEPITYAVSLVTMRTDKDGQFKEVLTETDEDRLVKSMVRFAPRRATIEPGKRQILKLMVRKPQDLPPGEYQTRLKLSPQPSNQQDQKHQTDSASSKKVSFDIEILVNSTFPIIIQNGDIAPEVTPLACSLQKSNGPNGLAAEVKLGRNGKGSAFGNVALQFIPANNPKAIRQIGLLEDMAIGIPKTEETFTVPLSDISRQELLSGAVRVSFQPKGNSDRQSRTTLGPTKDFPVR